jgi:hypothetical protein
MELVMIYVVGFCWVYDAYCLVEFVIFADLFIDPPRDKNDLIVHLSSVVIENGTIPKDWPLASTLEPGNPENSGVQNLQNLPGRTPVVNIANEELENSMYLKCFKLQLFIAECWLFLISKMTVYLTGDSVLDLANDLVLHHVIQQLKVIIDEKKPERLFRNQGHYPFQEVLSPKQILSLFKNSR